MTGSSGRQRLAQLPDQLHKGVGSSLSAAAWRRLAVDADPVGVLCEEFGLGADQCPM